MTIADLPAWTNYLDAVPEGALVERLPAHLEAVSRALAAVPDDKAGHAYAPGKWTVRELLGHMLVSQRIFVSRAVVIARGETQGLPGYDENAYARDWPAGDVSVGDLAAAYAAEARSTLAWLRLLRPAELEREGVANNLRIRPSWMFRALVGHESHHLGVLRERYGITA